MDGLMDGRTDRRTDGHDLLWRCVVASKKVIYKISIFKTYGRIDGRTNGQTDGRTHTWTDIWRDKVTDIQTDGHTLPKRCRYASKEPVQFGKKREKKHQLSNQGEGGGAVATSYGLNHPKLLS